LTGYIATATGNNCCWPQTNGRAPRKVVVRGRSWRNQELARHRPDRARGKAAPSNAGGAAVAGRACLVCAGLAWFWPKTSNCESQARLDRGELLNVNMITSPGVAAVSPSVSGSQGTRRPRNIINELHGFLANGRSRLRAWRHRAPALSKVKPLGRFARRGNF
jgi:hypothetical protein